jgi:ribosomal protein L9
VGQAGEVVAVAAGFARNFLIPQKKALPGLEKYVQMAHTFRLVSQTCCDLRALDD